VTDEEESKLVQKANDFFKKCGRGDFSLLVHLLHPSAILAKLNTEDVLPILHEKAVWAINCHGDINLIFAELWNHKKPITFTIPQTYAVPVGCYMPKHWESVISNLKGKIIKFVKMDGLRIQLHI
jgi:hypothetical protein